MPETEFTVHVHLMPPVAILRAVGDLDLATAPALEAALTRCLEGGATRVRIDMSATTFMSCAGVNAVIAARRHGALFGATVHIQAPSVIASRVLALAGCCGLLDDEMPRPQRAETLA